MSTICRTDRAFGPTRSGTLPEAGSLLLDIIRFAAAVAVVVDHLSLPEFHAGWADKQIYGYISVPVFFVLSGFVIRFVTRTRETTFREYMIDRASRIYSVVLPSIVVTIALSIFCFLLHPAGFRLEYGRLFSNPFSRLFLNLTFLSQAWGHNTIPFIDIPFWSLGYECPFYVLYGCAFLLRGWLRWAGMTVAALLSGPQVLFLFPVWLLGCLLYDVFVLVRGTRTGRMIPAVSGLWLFVGATLAVAGHHGLLFAPLRALQWVAELPNPLQVLHQPVRRATMLAVSAGAGSMVALLILLLAVDSLPLPRSGKWTLVVIYLTQVAPTGCVRVFWGSRSIEPWTCRVPVQPEQPVGPDGKRACPDLRTAAD
jgi:peptidoglycan/LPS O-acetylase OafA/YrhL